MMTEPIFSDTRLAFAHKSDRELKHAANLFQLMSYPWLVNAGARFTALAMACRLPLSSLYRYTVYEQFCGGETFDECKRVIENLSRSGVKAMLNYGVELKETEADFEASVRQNLQAIEFAGKNPASNVVCIKISGFGRFGLFEKMQEGKNLTEDEREEFQRVEQRFVRLAEAAVQAGAILFTDAEESWIQDPLDQLTTAMMRRFNHSRAVVYNTFQMYRHDRLAYLKGILAQALSEGWIPGAKLVRGAYMEKERERASSMGYPSPIHRNKAAVDHDFNEAVAICLDQADHIGLCIASQSESSCALAAAMIDSKGIARNHPGLSFSQLYGMGDNITFILADMGFNAYKYLPYGPVKDVIPYLIRRAQENTSVAGQVGRELRLLREEIKRRKLGQNS
jgi:proline dehydrogenase